MIGNLEKENNTSTLESHNISAVHPHEKVENELQAQIKKSISILKSMTDIRPDKVQLGKSLIKNPSYPNDEVLDKVADALLGDQDI